MRNLSHNAIPMLLCIGPAEHTARLPDVRGADGATGPVQCSECGSPMIVVDLIVVDRDPSWGTLPRGSRSYYS